MQEIKTVYYVLLTFINIIIVSSVVTAQVGLFYIITLNFNELKKKPSHEF